MTTEEYMILLDKFAKTFYKQWGKHKPYKNWKELKQTCEDVGMSLPSHESFAEFCAKKLKAQRVREKKRGE